MTAVPILDVLRMLQLVAVIREETSPATAEARTCHSDAGKEFIILQFDWFQARPHPPDRNIGGKLDRYPLPRKYEVNAPQRRRHSAGFRIAYEARQAY